ncbi:hypothetical protein [Enterococcus faecium]|nr:hypothetical protein [Enterococcus faecium]
MSFEPSYHSPKGEIIKEPFATLMGEPNTNGVSWFTSDDGLYGLVNIDTGEIVKEPFAYMISTFNSNGIATMMLNEGDNYSIISEEGNIIEETDYAYISSFTDDNLASYREYSNRPLGVLKVDFEN